MPQFFELSSDQIRVRDILDKKNFLEIEIYAISDANPNNNKSHFTLESMMEGKDTFRNRPILGFFNKGDFVAHQGKANYDPELDVEFWDNSDGEQILGFIRDSDQVEIVERNGLNWIRCTAMVCTRYNYKQIKKLLKDKNKKVSVEIQILDSEDIDGITHINKFELLGITILGSRNGVSVKEGIEGAHLSVLDLIDNARYTGQQQALMFEYSQLENLNKEEDSLAEEKIETLELDENVPCEGPCELCEEQEPVDESPECENPECDQEEEIKEENSECDHTEEYIQESLECEEQRPEETEEERKQKELETECGELRMKCDEYEAKCVEYEQRCAEYEAKCANFENCIAELEERNKVKNDEYEQVKAALNEANDKLNSIFIGEQCKYIDTLAKKMKFTSEEIQSIKEKCEQNKYASNDEIDKDMAYIMFQKQSFGSRGESEEQFSAGIVEIPMPQTQSEKSRRNQSVIERLKNN